MSKHWLLLLFICILSKLGEHDFETDSLSHLAKQGRGEFSATYTFPPNLCFSRFCEIMNVRCGGGKVEIQWTSAEFHLLYHSLFPISPPPPPLLLLSLFVPEAAAAGEAPILTLPPPPPIPPPPLPSPLSYPPLSQSSQSQLSHNLGPSHFTWWCC